MQERPPMSESDSIELPVDAQVTFFYYKDLAAPECFYGEMLGFRKTFDKGWVKFFQLTPRSYVGIVDEARGHHKALDQKSVMLSMETPKLEDWYERAKQRGADIQSHPDFPAARQNMITSFMLRDPGGYTVEFFRFNRWD
jgi:Glyoxalase/Bleomycin resistance protein/Dioxygenase superfamily